jgi:hypothetical protein
MSQKLEYELKGKSDVEQVTGRAKKSVDDLDAKFNKFGKDLLGKFVGFTAAAALFDKALNFVGDTFREFGNIADQVEKSGLSAEQFQALAFAAQQSGVSIQSLAKATRQLRTDMADAAAGNAAQAAKFEALGITMEQLRAGNADAVFKAIAVAMSDASSEADKLTIAQGMFGDKVGNDIIPMLTDVLKLHKDIAKAPIVDAETLKMIGDYNDRVDELIAKFKVLTAFSFNFFTSKYNPVGAGNYVLQESIRRMFGIEDNVAAPAARPGSAAKVIDAMKKGEKPEKEKAADTKGMTVHSVSGNVIGVGSNPVVTALQEQQAIAREQLACLQVIAAKGSTPASADITASGVTPNTPANTSTNRSPLVTKSK